MNWNSQILFLSVISCILLFLYSCRYSFNGTSLAPDEKTVSVQRFENQATIVVPTLAQNITEALRNRFITRTKLQLTPNNGDLQFSGTIINYNIEPLTITGGDKAAQNRLTVRVKVKYINTKHTNQNWESEFQQFADRPTTFNVSSPSVQNEMLEEIQEKLVQDIFNKALSNW